nr:LysM peptidoglycan-binding domain-containing protein [Bacteroidales bacterium]
MMDSLKRYLTAILTMLIVLNVPMLAQEKVIVNRSENKVVLEGKIYYVHVVKRGHTLYSISKAYNVSEKEIIIENPGASQDLIIGQVLKIPSDPSSAFKIDTKDVKQRNKQHEFEKGETMYSISRKYQCSLEDILELNPGLDINDIPIGHIITLPILEPEQNELSFDEEGFIFHKVKRGESLGSISRYYEVSTREIRAANVELGWGGPRTGDVIRIPKANTVLEATFNQDTIEYLSQLEIIDSTVLIEEYKYEELLDLDSRDSRLFRVAYLIPFNYSEMEVLDTLLKDVKSAILRKRMIEDYILEAAKPKSVNFLEFLEGSLLAIDSLSDAGMSLDIHVYDTKRSMQRMRYIMDSTDLKDMDLI